MVKSRFIPLDYIVKAKDGWGKARIGTKQLKNGIWRAYLLGKSPSLTMPMRINGNYVEANSRQELEGILGILAKHTRISKELDEATCRYRKVKGRESSG